MSLELYYGKPKPQEFSEVVDQFSVKQINSPQTSTLPLLQYWKNNMKGKKSPEKNLKKFLKNLDINYNQDHPIQLCFEYPTSVKSKNAKGKASMTDLMIIGDGFKIAIEGKYTEYRSKYEPVETWLTKGESAENRAGVLKYWFGFLKHFCGIPDDVINEPSKHLDKIGDIPYQFLHRVASACEGKPDRACVVYQIFYDEETESDKDDFVEELKKASDKLAPKENLKIAIQTVQVRFAAEDIPKDDRKEETREKALQRIKDKKLKLYEIEKEDWILIR